MAISVTLAVTHSYLFLDQVVQQPASISGYPNNSYDLGSGSARAIHDHEMDPLIVTDSAYSSDLMSGLVDIPTISLALGKEFIYGNNGFYETDDIEVPVSMEILYAGDPDSNLFLMGGIESHSHLRLKRSMRINFRSEYGYSKLDSDVMQRSVRNGQAVSDNFDRVILRGGNNRAWSRNWNPDQTTFTEDQFYRDTQMEVSGLGSHGVFVHAYINGIYWGMFNMVERPDDNFMAEYMGGDDDDWFYIKHQSEGKGDNTRYSVLVDDLINRNMSNAANYQELQNYLDIDKYIDYVLVGWWTALDDWPSNNFYGGNRSSASPLGSTPFRYYAWDGEWSWDRQRTGSNPSGQARVHSAFLASATNISAKPVIARIWHALKNNSDFLQRVRERVDNLTAPGRPLSDEAAIARWNQLNQEIENAVVAESARWGDAMISIDGKTRSRDNEWVDAVDAIRGFLSGNSAALKSSMRVQGYYQ